MTILDRSYAGTKPRRRRTIFYSRGERLGTNMTDTTAQGFNAANYFMPRNARQLQTRMGAGDHGRIGVTDSTCFHANPNGPAPGSRTDRSTTRRMPGASPAPQRAT